MSTVAGDPTARLRTPSRARPARAATIRVAIGLGVLLAAVILNWLLWASTVPFGEAPDEPSHLEVAQLIADHGRLPRFGPAGDLYVRLDQSGIPIESHALAPPLPYLIDALAIRAWPGSSVTAARLGSLLAAGAAVALTWYWARSALPGRRVPALAVAALVAVVPEVSFLAAVVNSDVFALAAAAGVAATWQRSRRLPGAMAFGLAVGLGLLTKYTVYPVVAVAVLAAAWRALNVPPATRAWWVRCLPLGCAALLAAGVAGPWFLHNWQAYGAPLPLAVSDAAFRALLPELPTTGAQDWRAGGVEAYARLWWDVTWRSFWAGFGHVNLFPPAWVYAVIALLLSLAVLGGYRLVARASACRARSPITDRASAWVLVGWPLAVGLAAVAASMGRYFPVHGRYLIVALPPLALAWMMGWQAVWPRLGRAVAPWLLVAAVAGLNLYCLIGVVVPRYYGPASARVNLTVDAPRPGDRVSGGVEVRGWAIVTGRGAWQLGAIGGSPAWHAVGSTLSVTVDGAPSSDLDGGGGVARADLVRALADPAILNGGFVYRWSAASVAPGIHVLEVCAGDARALGPVCVPISVWLDDTG